MRAFATAIPTFTRTWQQCLPEFRDLGVGRRLKLAQRDDALARGIPLIEWTFDPLQTRNATSTSAASVRLCSDTYSMSTAPPAVPLHAGLPTDRLVAEWHLASPRVIEILGGQCTCAGYRSPDVSELSWTSLRLTSVAEVQAKARKQFQELFSAGYLVTWFEREPGGGTYILSKP